VISYAFWQRQFDGRPDVVGRRLTLQGIPFTIVGVTPETFSGPEVGRAYDVAVPFGAEPLIHGAVESWLPERTTWWLSIIVRLEDGQRWIRPRASCERFSRRSARPPCRRTRPRESARIIFTIRSRSSQRRPASPTFVTSISDRSWR
jgi:hypothetical protein